MRPWEEHGLGMRQVLEYIGIPVSIPEPIVMSEDTRGRRIGGVLIDNAEEIIRAYAAEHFNAPVIAYTITVDGDGDSV